MINENLTILKSAYISEESYQDAIDTALGEFLEGFQRKCLEPNLIVYDQGEATVFRMVFFDISKMTILLVYTFDSEGFENKDMIESDHLLYLNYTLLFPKFGRDLDGHPDIKYAFSVDSSFSMRHLNIYMEQMEKTLQRIRD